MKVEARGSIFQTLKRAMKAYAWLNRRAFMAFLFYQEVYYAHG
jgi:hypothetical protein